MKIQWPFAVCSAAPMFAAIWFGCGSDAARAPLGSDAGDSDSAVACGNAGQPCCPSGTCPSNSCADGCTSTNACLGGVCQSQTGDAALPSCSADHWCFSQVVDGNGYAVSTFRGVWGSGPKDVWAVGEGTNWHQNSGVMEHFNGSTWEDPGGSAFEVEALSGVWGAASNDVWAVSDIASNRAGVVHWSGTALTTQSQTPGWFRAVWGSGSNDVWAVGDDGIKDVAWHGDGSGWTRSNLGSLCHLAAVWGGGANDVWAGGGCFIRKDANGWTTVALPAPGLAVHGIWGSAANDVWAVGESISDAGKTGAILHFDGSAWSVQTSVADGLNAVWGSAANDAWAVGSGGTVLHWNGTTWSPSASGTTNTLYGVWGSSAADVWVVGDLGVLHRSP